MAESMRCVRRARGAKLHACSAGAVCRASRAPPPRSSSSFAARVLSLLTARAAQHQGGGPGGDPDARASGGRRQVPGLQPGPDLQLPVVVGLVLLGQQDEAAFLRAGHGERLRVQLPQHAVPASGHVRQGQHRQDVLRQAGLQGCLQGRLRHAVPHVLLHRPVRRGHGAGTAPGHGQLPLPQRPALPLQDVPGRARCRRARQLPGDGAW
jgi:hypothetical protein